MFEYIKQNTRDHHASLEKFFISRIRSFSAPGHYAAFLECLYSFYQPLGESIRLYINDNILADLAERRSAEWLLTDLRALGSHSQGITFATIQHVNCLSSAAGAMYVLEGSTHGGTHIARMIRHQVALPENAFTFFNGYGTATASRWDEFKRSISSPSHLINLEVMTESANITFLSLQEWIKNKYPQA